MEAVWQGDRVSVDASTSAQRVTETADRLNHAGCWHHLESVRAREQESGGSSKVILAIALADCGGPGCGGRRRRWAAPSCFWAKVGRSRARFPLRPGPWLVMPTERTRSRSPCGVRTRFAEAESLSGVGQRTARPGVIFLNKMRQVIGRKMKRVLSGAWIRAQTWPPGGSTPGLTWHELRRMVRTHATVHEPVTQPIIVSHPCTIYPVAGAGCAAWREGWNP